MRTKKPLGFLPVFLFLAAALFLAPSANAQHVHGEPQADAPRHGARKVKPQGWPDPVMDQMPFFYVATEQLEYRLNDGDDTVRWDINGWYGGDYNKLWFKTEGESAATGPGGGQSENQLLYSRLIAPFWEAQIGVRYDETWGRGADPSRAFAVLGLQGYAPYRFEVEPALFISEDGDVSAKFTGSADFFLTQRLVIQPRVDTELAVQDAKRFGEASGFNNVELGLRLSYQIRRRFAPYIGVHWTRLVGETASLARAEGEETSTVGLVAGLRLWY